MGIQESSAPHQDPGRDWPGILAPPPRTEHGAPTLLGFCDHGEIPPWLQTPSREAAWDTLPSPTSSIIPASQRARLVPREKAPGDMRGVTREVLCYFLSSRCSGCGSPSRGAPQSLMAETPHMSGAHKWHLASMSSVISEVLGPDPGSQSLCLLRVPLCPELPLHPPQGLQCN